MTDEPNKPAKSPRPVGPLDRWGLGTIAVIQVLLAVVALLAVNYLGFHHYRRIDLSRTEDYSLSPATVSLLTADQIVSRQRPVRWVLTFRRTTPFYERVRAIAEEYARLSGGRITLEVVDPLRSPERTQEVAASYGLTLVRDVLIIDARNDDTPAIREDEHRVKSLHPNVRLVLAEELAVHAIDGASRKIVGFNGEDILTSRLMEAIEGRPKRMALLADKTRLSRDRNDSPVRGLSERLRLQNIELVDLPIASVNTIPDDIEGLVIAAPSYDLTESEMKTLESYWNRPRAALLVLTNSEGTPQRLRTFLRAHGITPQRDRVVQQTEKGVTTTLQGRFAQGVPFLGGLSGQSTTFDGASASIEVRENAEDLIARRIFPIGLVEVAAGSWGETRFGEGPAVFDEAEDRPSPFHLAASAIRGAESDDRFAEESARMIVISNIDFLNPENPTRTENLDFLSSSVNWLVGRKAPLGIGPRPIRPYRLPLLDAQVSFINRANLMFLPALLLLAGGFIWSSRRA